MKRKRMLLGSAAIAVACVVAAAILLHVAQVRAWRAPPISGGVSTIRLITGEQYVSVVHELFGEDIRVDVSFALPQRRQGLLALGYSRAEITPGELAQFDRTARAIASQVM